MGEKEALLEAMKFLDAEIAERTKLRNGIANLLGLKSIERPAKRRGRKPKWPPIIKKIVCAEDGMRPAEVTKELHDKKHKISPGAVRSILLKMVKDGVIDKRGGKYYPPAKKREQSNEKSETAG
jgi:hypothetical protein